MKHSRKSPTNRVLRKVLPYIVLFSIVIVILMIGFFVGYITAPTVKASDSVSEQITPTQPQVEIVEPEIQEVEWIEFVATAYCPCEKCCGVWATKRPLDENGEQIVYGASGIVLRQGVSVAADTSVYPMGTELEIENLGTYVVQDRGGAIKGNRLDFYFDNHTDARNFGRKTVRVRVEK